MAGYLGRVRSLSDYLDLTVEQARSQWGQILRRQPKPRQEPFTPVEAILCYGLFFVMDPHRYGGGSIHRAPRILHDLAALFVRPPGSVNSKMMNLDGSRANAGAHEWRFFIEMAADPDQFPHLYNRVLRAARDMGVDEDRLPDFLTLEGIASFDLLGQEELARQHSLDAVLEVRAAKKRVRSLATHEDTTRMAEHEIRVGQHRFAKQVLENFDHSCGFCGFAPRSLPGNRLLVASHIKPWADCDDHERMDVQNGVAACPTHDAAFDSGLITVNGGLRVHRASKLEVSSRADPGVGQYFGQALKPELIIPEQGQRPGDSYLAWHRENVFQGTVKT
ncbi:MAG: HNH endonuclease [bacterium]|nr:HNH endonuclease [bacterium]